MTGSSDYNYYQKLKTIYSYFKYPFFLKKINVIVWFQIVSTINDFITIGDKIKKIDFILNS
ncbi:hypothetical protein [Blattabacterium punctulatus]|uniref:hypothetical protein n=1 Tax=Blattabacterium punctulatus TaxID=164514 RepID=UPI001F26C0A1|nr:hypothetical protein [Blattabacterium punctulatus]